MRKHFKNWMRLALIAALILVTAAPAAMAQAKFQEQAGTLPDGTQYRMRVPPNWNKVLINDLDYAGGGQRLAADSDKNLYLLERGYALSGTARHPRREFEYDPLEEMANLMTVLDMFEAKFGKPNRIIQYGQSGGGFLTLLLAETHADRINGAVAGCAHTPVWLMNTGLDGWFVLKALLGPDLTITDLPEDRKEITAAWRKVFEAAQQTPQGRARMALAVTVGQWSAWGTNAQTPITAPKPDPKDVAALQKSMYDMLMVIADQAGGQSRFMMEHGGKGQLSWNTGIDHKKLFDNGNEDYKRAVRQLYSQAGLDLNADLEKVNAFPRISAKPGVLEDFWSKGRTVTGTPKIPVLRIHTSGDMSVPIALMEGYNAKVHANGRDNLYRTAVIERTGHCTFSAAESTAAIETVMRRLDTGGWGNTTEPEQLNKLATSFNRGEARYIKFTHEKYNRPWFPGTNPPASGSRTN